MLRLRRLWRFWLLLELFLRLLLLLLLLLLLFLLLRLLLLLLLLLRLLLLLLLLLLLRWLCRRLPLRLLVLGLLRTFRSLGPLNLGVHRGDTGFCISVGRRGIGSDRIRGFRSRGALFPSDLGIGSRCRGLRW